LRSELEQRVRSLGLESKISLPGSVEQSVVFRGIAAADVFAFPSVNEPFGLALAEAMALGAPVVATTVDGLPELVEDGVSGKLIPPRDAQGLAEAITELASDRALRARLTAAAQRRASERFDIKVLSARLVAMYKRALGGEIEEAHSAKGP